MKPLEEEISFFVSLAKLLNRDGAARAILKRSLSNEPKHRFERYSIVLPRLPRDLPAYNRDHWVLCASLFALHPQEEIWHEGDSFGWSCRELEAKVTTQGVDRRFRLLLNQQPQDLAAPLTSLLRWADSNKVPVDYPTLLSDLCRWGHPAQYIQERWAKDFWKRAD